VPGKKNHPSALKAGRRDARKTVYRSIVRASTRTRIKKARTLLAAKVQTVATAETVMDAIRALDKAAEKGVIHKNNAARRKSRLMAAFNKPRTAA
jgi:small subunit ribosomal protein S20